MAPTKVVAGKGLGAFVTHAPKYAPSLAIQDPTVCKSAPGATAAAKHVGR